MSIKEQLAELPREQRLECMEALWDTLRSDDLESPSWHADVLAGRKEAFETGQATFVSESELLEKVNRKIGRS